MNKEPLWKLDPVHKKYFDDAREKRDIEAKKRKEKNAVSKQRAAYRFFLSMSQTQLLDAYLSKAINLPVEDIMEELKKLKLVERELKRKLNAPVENKQ